MAKGETTAAAGETKERVVLTASEKRDGFRWATERERKIREDLDGVTEHRRRFYLKTLIDLLRDPGASSADSEQA